MIVLYDNTGMGVWINLKLSFHDSLKLTRGYILLVIKVVLPGLKYFNFLRKLSTRQFLKTLDNQNEWPKDDNVVIVTIL